MAITKQTIDNTVGNSALIGSGLTGFTALVTEYYSTIMLLITAAGLLVGWYYKYKADKRAQEKHDIEKQRFYQENNR